MNWIPTAKGGRGILEGNNLTRMGPWREQEAPEGRSGGVAAATGSQAQVKAQLKQSHYPMEAKWELLGADHHKGRRQATQGTEEKYKWVWQHRSPM